MQRAILRLMNLVAAVGFRQPRTVPKFEEFRGEAFAAIAHVLEPYRAELRADPAESARILHGMTIAFTHPMMTDRPIHDPGKIVDIFLRGLAVGGEITA